MKTEKPIEAYPLAWPPGRPRTAPHRRTWSKFKAQFGRARDRCLGEIRTLGGRQTIISSNLPLRIDGLPYANARPDNGDSGVAVYFTYKSKQMCFACDRWAKVEDNMHAIALTINALRGVARWGTGDMMEAAFTGFAALPSPGQATARGWMQILEVGHDVTLEKAKENYRRLSMIRHPDRGGSEDAMSELNWAWAQAQEALGAQGDIPHPAE